MENLVRILDVAYIFFGQGKLLHIWNAIAAILDFIGESFEILGRQKKEMGEGEAGEYHCFNTRDTQ